MAGAREAGVMPAPVEGFDSVPGHGVQGRIGGVKVLFDNQRTAEAIGRLLGIERVIADVLPAD